MAAVREGGVRSVCLCGGRAKGGGGRVARCAQRGGLFFPGFVFQIRTLFGFFVEGLCSLRYFQLFFGKSLFGFFPSKKLPSFSALSAGVEGAQGE